MKGTAKPGEAWVVEMLGFDGKSYLPYKYFNTREGAMCWFCRSGGLMRSCRVVKYKATEAMIKPDEVMDARDDVANVAEEMFRYIESLRFPKYGSGGLADRCGMCRWRDVLQAAGLLKRRGE